MLLSVLKQRENTGLCPCKNIDKNDNYVTTGRKALSIESKKFTKKGNSLNCLSLQTIYFHCGCRLCQIFIYLISVYKGVKSSIISLVVILFPVLKKSEYDLS